MKTLQTQSREEWGKKLEGGKDRVELQHDFSEGQSCMEAMSLAEARAMSQRRKWG